MLPTLVQRVLAVGMGVLLQMSTCNSGVGVGVDVDVDRGQGQDEPDGGSNGGPPSGIPSNSVLVRFANRTDLALDVEFFASGSADGDVDTGLFDPANQIKEGIGFAGTGLIAADGTDQLTLLCDSAQMVGTLGGRFVHQDTGELFGVGDRRVATLGLQYDCGGTVTFSFQPNASGSGFTTILVVE